MKIPVYVLRADRETGEWLTSPEPTGELVEFAEWDARESSYHYGYDIREHFNEDGSAETRALIVKWQ